MDKNSKIYVAGHTGLVGSAICRRLAVDKYTNVLTARHCDVDLENVDAVHDLFARERPEYVFLAAAKVGGIYANNKYPVDFLIKNLAIQTNVVSACHTVGVKKLLFLGSSCIYPRECTQPIKEEYILSGNLEETNKPYALAKISGMCLIESYNRQYGTNFIGAMPTNLYGPNDNFDLETSHVLPALIRKFHEAKVRKEDAVELWGTGKPKREFLYVDDLAEALIFLMKNLDSKDHLYLNVGTGKDITIWELANLVSDIVGFCGDIFWKSTMPDGTPKKLLDVSKINKLGWKATISLEEGIKATYAWYRDNHG